MSGIHPITILGNSSIGIFGFSTDSYCLLPLNITEELLIKSRDVLQTSVLQLTVNNSHLLGLYGVGNSHHLLLPDLVTQDEIDQIKSGMPDDVEIHVLNSPITAFGNVIVTNDKQAIVSEEFTSKEQSLIAEMLDVEVTPFSLLNTTIIGSMLFLSRKGLLAHPLISDSTLDWLETYFKVPVDVVTVNRGTPFPRPGIIANKNGVLVGSDTTGPELMRIFEVLLTD